jgi:hypothetical protein
MSVYEYTNKYNTFNNLRVRKLNAMERKAIAIIESFIKTFHEELYRKYKNVQYTTGKNSKAWGLYETGSFNDGLQHIFLTLEIFTMPFAHSVGFVLHEWLHIYGGDGSKEFTYALTDCIKLILSDKQLIKKTEQFAKEWRIMTKEIIDQNIDKENKINNLYWQRIGLK